MGSQQDRSWPITRGLAVAVQMDDVGFHPTCHQAQFVERAVELGCLRVHPFEGAIGDLDEHRGQIVQCRQLRRARRRPECHQDDIASLLGQSARKRR